MTYSIPLQGRIIDTDAPHQRLAYLGVALKLKSNMVRHLTVPAFMAIELNVDCAKLGFNSVKTAFNRIQFDIDSVDFGFIRLLRQLRLNRIKASIHVDIQLRELFVELPFGHNCFHFMSKSIAIQDYSRQ